MSDRAASDRFYGSRAAGYDARRSGRPFWAKEHAVVRDMLLDLPAGSAVIDVPVGTGRYFPIYKELGFNVCGLDLSHDMLDEAEAAARRHGFSDLTIWHGDVLALPSVANDFDVVVCTRLLNWLAPMDMAQAVAEIVRVCRNRIIVSIELRDRRRAKHDNQPHLENAFLEAVAGAGAEIVNRVLIEPDYWMFRMRKSA